MEIITLHKVYVAIFVYTYHQKLLGILSLLVGHMDGPVVGQHHKPVPKTVV